MKKLPIDVSNFKTMITQDYVYVDKTEHIYRLIIEGRLYFLSRPRRFGKSLLLSTLKELFSGNKKLIGEVLETFFTVIKSLSAYIRFICITGVTKFSKTSIFSGMNNLNDISLDLPAAVLLGYTQEEIENYFEPFIASFAHEANQSTHSIKEDKKLLVRVGYTIIPCPIA
jgi:hypothetical protein